MARPRTHDDTVQLKLLEAASESIAARGVEGLSLRSVASQAGTTTAAVYSLFGNRDELIDAVVQEGFGRFAARLETVEQSDDALADLLALGLAYRQNALEDSNFYRVMFSAAPYDPENSTFQTLTHAVARAIDCESEQARVHAERVWAYVHGLVSLELAGLRPGTEQERAAAYTEALQAGAAMLPLS
ncbi:TetR/AcrR family transcriptional regulator [Nesterenkonia cremea]|uniref:TetR family transcriptional regulator n=1 Tax=Nesterenkonia cremea TaxID=1882340 RepID=A0A917ERY8_9MICC|nr:TetR/AcrR family transcriptional regulator [Nesterenkonia cremea]GGE71893.1 TetR family transcriptional regulator [Nesterenkonia cremea]